MSKAVRPGISGGLKVSSLDFSQDKTLIYGKENGMICSFGTVGRSDCALCSHPFPASPPGLRGTLDLQVIRVRMEEPPAVSLLQDWSKHPQGTKRVGTGDNPDWPTVLSESSATVKGHPGAGSGV